MTGERRTHATTASWWNGLGNLEACPQECGHGSLKGYATGRDEESTSCGWVSGEDSALSEKPHRVDRPYALPPPPEGRNAESDQTNDHGGQQKERARFRDSGGNQVDLRAAVAGGRPSQSKEAGSRIVRSTATRDPTAVAGRV